MSRPINWKCPNCKSNNHIAGWRFELTSSRQSAKLTCKNCEYVKYSNSRAIKQMIRAKEKER